MRSHKHIAGWILGMAMAAVAPATTLVKLNLDEMVAKSTDIVRGKVTGCQAGQRGASIVTDCVVKVSERLKGTTASTMAISVPGGVMKSARGKVRQVIAGAPEFNERTEYLLFLWTGRNGITQLIGLSQGVLEVSVQNGQVVAARAPNAAVTYQDAQGREVEDAGVSVTFDRIRHLLGNLSKESR
jgi:hypothetical protein